MTPEVRTYLEPEVRFFQEGTIRARSANIMVSAPSLLVPRDVHYASMRCVHLWALLTGLPVIVPGPGPST